MKKPTDFSYALTKFLTDYLAGLCNFSENTICSYRDTFKLLLLFFNDEIGIPAESLKFDDVMPERIEAFLRWLKESRGSSISTCNQRLAAIHTFFRYSQYEHPELTVRCQQILFMKFAKVPQKEISYLSIDGVKSLFEIPDVRTVKGRRELAILTLLYDSGARVQEIVDLRAGDIRLAPPATVRLTGKGRKSRNVPLLDGNVAILAAYMNDQKRYLTTKDDYLFLNHSHRKMTRAGINYILQKNVDAAYRLHPDLIPEQITPHCLRHTKALHLLQGGVNLIYIRDFLGHVDVKTTQVYAKADVTLKRKAIEAANLVKVPSRPDSWTDDEDLMQWLVSLGKK